MFFFPLFNLSSEIHGFPGIIKKSIDPQCFYDDIKIWMGEGEGGEGD